MLDGPMGMTKMPSSSAFRPTPGLPRPDSRLRSTSASSWPSSLVCRPIPSTDLRVAPCCRSNTSLSAMSARTEPVPNTRRSMPSPHVALWTRFPTIFTLDSPPVVSTMIPAHPLGSPGAGSEPPESRGIENGGLRKTDRARGVLAGDVVVENPHGANVVPVDGATCRTGDLQVANGGVGCQTDRVTIKPRGIRVGKPRRDRAGGRCPYRGSVADQLLTGLQSDPTIERRNAGRGCHHDAPVVLTRRRFDCRERSEGRGERAVT